MTEHALVVPANFTSRDVASAMIDARGKEITQECTRSIRAVFGVSPLEIAKVMETAEVSEDVKQLLEELVSMCS
jgi:hypothetical protein